MSTDPGFTWNEEYKGWFSRHKLSNGQYCMIGLLQSYFGRSVCYYVCFAVANKKKNLNGWFDENRNNNIECRTTGRCGIEALLWCRDKLLNFEQFVRLEKHKSTKIFVCGSDSRRFRVYEKALLKYGYKKVFMHGTWSMVKILGQANEEEAESETN